MRFRSSVTTSVVPTRHRAVAVTTLIILTIVMDVLGGAVAVAEEKTVAAESQVDAEKWKPGKWQTLLHDDSLKNWKVTQFGGQGEVGISQGALMLHYGVNLTGVTWDGPELPKTNYEVRLEAKRVDGSDFFCGLTFPVGEQSCSLILGGWGGGVVGLSSIDDFDASENGTTQFRSFKEDEWYPIRLRVTPENIQVWLEKEQIIDQDIAGKKVSIRNEVELSKPFGICTWCTTGAIRKLKMQVLPVEQPDAKEPVAE